MDESRVEVDIEISRAMQLIDTTAEWELRELQTFTSTLIGQAHVSAESNPFRPLVYATRALGRGVRDRRLADPACDLPANFGRSRRRAAQERGAAASTRLESQGVQPGLTDRGPASGASFGAAVAEPARPGAQTRCCEHAAAARARRSRGDAGAGEEASRACVAMAGRRAPNSSRR